MTQIDVFNLIQLDTKPTCIGKIISWVARRETTRIEDMTYCLLGLCGVHMPLLYDVGLRITLPLVSIRPPNSLRPVSRRTCEFKDANHPEKEEFVLAVLD